MASPKVQPAARDVLGSSTAWLQGDLEKIVDTGFPAVLNVTLQRTERSEWRQQVLCLGHALDRGAFTHMLTLRWQKQRPTTQVSL